MRLSEVSFPAQPPIDGYGPGFFRVGGEVRTGPLLLSSTGMTAWDGLSDAAALLALAGQVDVLLIGTGPEIASLPGSLRQALDQAGLAAEQMASPAACRTYNVLLAEGRRVAVALLPV
jgi:uncharacterized protein